MPADRERSAGFPEGSGKRGLLIDFGGVLTTSVWDSFSAFCRLEGLEEDRLRRLFREDPEALGLLRRLEVGGIAEDEFARQFGGILGIDDHEGLIDRLFAGMEPQEEMLEALRRARAAEIKTAMVSNSWGHGQYDRSLFGELFDGVVISGEVGLHKPHPEIFELAAQTIALPPSACVFVDDLRENCAGAEAVGMTAVLHREPDETLERLEALFGVPLR
jgi:epoxide hydrolase-like predicted phosphatase